MGFALPLLRGTGSPLLRGTGSWRAPAVWPSVDVVFVIRDLVSPRTWLAFSHNLVGLVIGMGTFIATITLLALGVVLLPLMLIGVPILGFTMRAAGWLARFERARFALFLGARIAAWPAAGRPGPRRRAGRAAAG